MAAIPDVPGGPPSAGVGDNGGGLELEGTPALDGFSLMVPVPVVEMFRLGKPEPADASGLEFPTKVET